MPVTIIAKIRIQKGEGTMMKTYENVESTFSWAVGNAYPDVKDITSLAADGDELQLIRSHFSFIPSCGGFCIWPGEMANFIHENLKHLTK